jgi:hypothetical protein
MRVLPARFLARHVEHQEEAPRPKWDRAFEFTCDETPPEVRSRGQVMQGHAADRRLRHFERILAFGPGGKPRFGMPPESPDA